MSQRVQLEVVDKKGKPLTTQPVDLNELLTRHNRAIQIGNGVSVSVEPSGNPPHQQREVEEVPTMFRNLSAREPSAVNISGNTPASTKGPTGGGGKGTLNPEEWVAAAPPTDKKVDFTKLVTLDLTQSRHSRKFQPMPLLMHSLVSYSDGASANKMLVYGGTTGVVESSELLEFSLNTATWRRVETLHACAGGVFGHTSTIYGKKMIVIGGFGRGGRPISPAVLKGAAEAKRFEVLCPYHGSTHPSPVPFGIMQVVQELTISTRTWNTLPIGHPLYMAGHTTVLYNGLLFCYGGVNERMEVQGDLLAIDPASGAVKMMRHAKGAPKKRFMHTATLYNNWMIVYGGLDESNDVLHDVWAFNFLTEEWEEMHVVGMEGGRFGHSAVVLGSRLLIFGGLSTLETGSDPSGVAEIILTPIKDAFKWRSVPLSKPFENMVMGVSAACGDGVSIFIYGGRGKPPVVLEDSESEEYEGSDDEAPATAPLVSKPTTQCLLVRFDDKPKPLTAKEKLAKKKAVLSEQPRAMSESLQTFLRRQEEFVRGKEMRMSKKDKEFVLEVKEAADSSLTLTQEEVQQTLDGMAGLIQQFNSYKMDDMPGQAPDKADRISHNEVVLKTLNQINENLISMKAKETTKAVKSKGHRRKAGEKFEDFSATKPFRRVVIMDLVKEVKKRFAALVKLNRNLSNFVWDAKDTYIEYTIGCQDKLGEFVSLLKEITDKYINHRIEVMEASRKSHSDVILSLRTKVNNDRQSRLQQSSVKSIKRTKSEIRRIPDKKITIQVATGEVDQWVVRADASLEGTKALRETCAGSEGPGKRHITISKECDTIDEGLAAFKTSLQEAPREGAVVPLTFRGYAELQHKCGHSIETIEKAISFVEAQSNQHKNDDDTPKAPLKLRVTFKALAKAFTGLQQAVGGRFLTGSTAMPHVVPDPPKAEERTKLVRRSSVPTTHIHVHAAPQHHVTEVASARATSEEAPNFVGLVEPLYAQVDYSSRPVTSEPRWFDPFGLTAQRKLPPVVHDDFFAPARVIRTPTLVPPIQTPPLPPQMGEGDLPTAIDTTTTTTVTTVTTESVPAAAVEDAPAQPDVVDGDESPVRAPPTAPDAPTPAPVKVSDTEEHGADCPPRIIEESGAGAGAVAEVPPSSSRGVQATLSEPVAGEAVGVRFLPAEEGTSDRFLEFLPPPSRDRFALQKENVGACSRCHCVNATKSKDRGMFKGRLTPGERSILENRMKNAM